MRRNDITKDILNGFYNINLLSKKEIALRLKCNITTISKKMDKFGILPRPQIEAVGIAMQKQIIKISKTYLKSLYLDKKLSIGKIAKNLNYCKETIKRELERNNIILRSKADAVRLGAQNRRIQKHILSNLYYGKKLTQKEIAQKLNRHPGNICNLMKYYKLKTRKPDFYHTKYKKTNFSDDPEEESYLIGFRLGDLYVKLLPSKKLITVGTTSTKIEQTRLFKKLFRKYGNVWISKKRKDGNRVFTVILNRSFDFLLPKKDYIPRWIQNNRKYFLSFLAGYTDAEGCILIAKNNVARFTLSSYDKNIIQQVHKNLLKIGVACNPPKIRVKKGYKKRGGIIYKKDEWCFSVNRKYPLQKLLILLKPLLKHQKRLRDLKKAGRNIIKRNSKVYKTLPEKISRKYLAV